MNQDFVEFYLLVEYLYIFNVSVFVSENVKFFFFYKFK